MRRVIHKIFWVWQLEKEQAWINEMASHGYSLEHAGRLTFEFEETEADLYTYKTLFLKGWADSEENRKYLKFLEEMGIKVVCYINYPGTTWIYTRALKADYPDGIDLFSDIDSRIKGMRVMAGYMIFVMLMMLSATLLNLWYAFGMGHFLPLNFICAAAVFVLSVFAAVATVRLFVNIGKLKKERAIHE